MWFIIAAAFALVTHAPFLAMAMAAALPMPLFAPVIMKDRPATDVSRSFSTKFLDADTNAPLEHSGLISFDVWRPLQLSGV